jgi:hypothetical protein
VQNAKGLVAVKRKGKEQKRAFFFSNAMCFWVLSRLTVRIFFFERSLKFHVLWRLLAGPFRDDLCSSLE